MEKVIKNEQRLNVSISAKIEFYIEKSIDHFKFSVLRWGKYFKKI